VIVSISLAALTGLAVFFLLRDRYLGPWSAVTTALFGYSLASTGLAPAINHLIAGIAAWAGHLH
jgi:hypothetical protein